MTKTALNDIEEEKKKKQQQWMLTDVETFISKAAENGQWSVNISIPTDYDTYEVSQFLQKAGYVVKLKTDKTINVSWPEAGIKVNVVTLVYQDPNTPIGGSDISRGLLIKKGDVFNKEFIDTIFPEEIDLPHLGGIGKRVSIEQYSTYNPNHSMQNQKRNLTPLNTCFLSATEICYAYNLIKN